MRRIMLGTVVLVGLAASGTQANALRPWYPWCAWVTPGGPEAATWACAYTSLQQCVDTVRGAGGVCGLNPYPPPPPVLPVQSRRKSVHR